MCSNLGRVVLLKGIDARHHAVCAGGSRESDASDDHRGENQGQPIFRCKKAGVMSDTVLAALISAGASILVAILSKNVESRKARQPHDTSSLALRTSSKINIRRWYVASAIFLLWLAVSPAFLHHDLAGENFLLIPVVTIVLALFVPISPLSAAWISLALFAANFVIGPLSNRLHGSQYDTAFIYEARERGKQLSILWIGFGTAAVASSICYFRLKFRGVIGSRPVSADDRNSVHPVDAPLGLAAELEKLAHMRAAGTLSDDEFRRAKKKLLDPH